MTDKQKDMTKAKKKTQSALDVLASEFGRRGGRAIAKKNGKDYFKKLGKKGAEKRWRKSEVKVK